MKNRMREGLNVERWDREELDNAFEYAKKGTCKSGGKKKGLRENYSYLIGQSIKYGSPGYLMGPFTIVSIDKVSGGKEYPFGYHYPNSKETPKPVEYSYEIVFSDGDNITITEEAMEELVNYFSDYEYYEEEFNTIDSKTGNYLAIQPVGLIEESYSKKKNRMREESYGWVILPANALDAYEEAIEYFGKESLDEQIVESLSQEELAKSLEFIFRMNDFNESSYLEESYSKKKPCTKGGKKGMRENESFSILKRYEKRYGK